MRIGSGMNNRLVEPSSAVPALTRRATTAALSNNIVARCVSSGTFATAVVSNNVVARRVSGGTFAS